VAPLTTGADGDKLSARVWKELMTEFQFAGVNIIIDRMRQASA